ncbi:unnamed protein product [Peniophora sp. CBMAI 1063]|nr:unnamed protein product [Peniophora sp. CBMAI 1063]
MSCTILARCSGLAGLYRGIPESSRAVLRYKNTSSLSTACTLLPEKPPLSGIITPHVHFLYLRMGFRRFLRRMVAAVKVTVRRGATKLSERIASAIGWLATPAGRRTVRIVSITIRGRGLVVVTGVGSVHRGL